MEKGQIIQRVFASRTGTAVLVYAFRDDDPPWASSFRIICEQHPSSAAVHFNDLITALNAANAPEEWCGSCATGRVTVAVTRMMPAPEGAVRHGRSPLPRYVRDWIAAEAARLGLTRADIVTEAVTWYARYLLLAEQHREGPQDARTDKKEPPGPWD